MKLVASSKLRRAQRSIEALRPYADTLSEILATASGSTSRELPPMDFASLIPPTPDGAGPSHSRGHGRPRSSEVTPEGVSPLVVVAFASNSSMCGAFNANVIKKTLEVARECEWNMEFWAFGRKMAEALRKEGHPATRDYSSLVAHPSFDAVAKVAEELRTLQQTGAISGAVLVYNHFVSTGRQLVVAESYLSADDCADAGEGSGGHFGETEPSTGPSDYILEPSAPELLETLMPQVLDLKLYAALLDSAASEHAARMIAMQTATDNAEELLASLTLEYNKGRQQKITSEILDLVGAEA